MVLRAVALLMVVFSLGCNQQIKDYVRGSRGSADSPSVSTPNIPGIKISTGSGTAQGSAVKSKFSITATSRTVEGSQVKSTFSLHRNRFD